MNFIKIDSNGYDKSIIQELCLNNIDFALLNFNILRDELKLYVDDIKINKKNISLYRCNCLVCSIDVSDVCITRVISTIPVNKEVNGLLLHELRYEYIISYKEFNPVVNKCKLNHLYLRSRNVLDYVFIKK